MSTTNAKKRRGAAIFEMIVVLPILFLALAAAVQFASVLSVDTTLCHASLEASRLCAMGCSEDQLSSRVDEFLSVHGMSLASGARIVVEDDAGTVLSAGDGSLTSSTIGSPVSSGGCRATLLVETDASPIPNLLRDYCVDFAGKQFEHVSVSCKPVCDCP